MSKLSTFAAPMLLLAALQVSAADYNINDKSIRLEGIPATVEDLSKLESAPIQKESFAGFLYSATEGNGKGLSPANFNTIDINDPQYGGMRDALLARKNADSFRRIDDGHMKILTDFAVNRMTEYSNATHYILVKPMSRVQDDASTGTTYVDSGFWGQSSVEECSGRIASVQDKASTFSGDGGASSTNTACIRFRNINGLKLNVDIPNNEYAAIDQVGRRSDLNAYLLVKRAEPLRWETNGSRTHTEMVADKLYIGDKNGNLLAGFKVDESRQVARVAPPKQERAINASSSKKLNAKERAEAFRRSRGMVDSLDTKANVKKTESVKIKLPGL